AGSPNGSQTATAKYQTYVDTTSGDIWVYNGTPPSNTGWVLQGGFYASLTGPGQTATPGELDQAGPFTITTPLTDAVGVTILDQGSGGITLDAFGTNGIVLNNANNSGIYIADTGSSGIQVAEFSNGVGITLTDNGNGG